MTRLSGHNAIVTGAGAGIGRAIAVRLATEGARVVVNDLHSAGAEKTVSLISAGGGAALTSIGDVSNSDDVEAAFQQCEENWGPAACW